MEYQQWHRHLDYKMQDYYDNDFWDLVHAEYGVTDELDIMSEGVTDIIQPMPGVIILITKDFGAGYA